MVPQPKRKLSSGRRDRRRSQDALTIPGMLVCSNCGKTILPHRICPSCGHYHGREIIAVEKEKKSKKS